jgi:transposase
MLGNIKQPLTKPSYEELEALLAKALERIAQLEGMLEKLQEQLGLTSQNSSKPPSSDAPWKPSPKSERLKSGRASGGQIKHLGHTLKWQTEIDATTHHAPQGNCRCGLSLENAVVVSVQKRQVLDLPISKVLTTEHHLETRVCQCGLSHQGVFPIDVKAHVQYGSRIRGQAVYLLTTQFLSLERCQQYFLEVYQTSISQGTLINWQKAAYHGLSEVETNIKGALQVVEVGYADETGIHVNGKLHWLHSFGTTLLTHYHVASKRGLEGMKLGGIIQHFKGILSHDCWSAYFKLLCFHALCNAHLLRELTRVFESTGQIWALSLKTLLCTMKRMLEETMDLAFETRIQMQLQFRELVVQGLLENPAVVRSELTLTTRGGVKQSYARTLLLRLERHEESWLRFLFDARVAFDNNLAERDVRMVKVREKVSGGSRGEGATWFARIRGYASTLRKQKQDVYQAFVDLFAGNVVLPLSLVSPNTS